ncbi:MAG: S-methyl-5'-thioadenosine phosphorylase [Eubacteriales bacterium]|jgi:5'-methylthioadenosine phosphorylase|nr:S-methyl-5'-thioadenosine phosphorylase [Bacillota bacterium]MBV1726610.1 S-methyl-5'-thioadenosine phosphorylase [Desulforudis sp.]MDQ7789139.1 S-methyl-5'-thioadenosine phosphorylase [Clostridia bacterium]MDZ4042851.1 S-methyl-5'-thioadenosine phosphorylase [Eubacteriales bacterium]MBU4554029.1 S-methyl-5'-thioadenosine phosphorylase [Bacillota bacterium]
MTVRIAIIGGTGVYDPEILDDVRTEQVSTPYGDISVNIGSYRGKPIAFISRHGQGHTVPPHRVNYRANIAGLKKLGVRSILATAAVGSLNRAMKPGSFVFVDQFLDFTKARAQTFFDGDEKGVVHCDVTDPYCLELREILVRAAWELRQPAASGGTYACTDGPRFESAAEITMIRQLGGDLVGMTGVPEVVLAREAEICYASIAMVTNFAAGISQTRLTHEEVLEVMSLNAENLRRLIMQAITMIGEERECACHWAVSGGPVHSKGEG